MGDDSPSGARHHLSHGVAARGPDPARQPGGHGHSRTDRVEASRTDGSRSRRRQRTGAKRLGLLVLVAVTVTVAGLAGYVFGQAAGYDAAIAEARSTTAPGLPVGAVPSGDPSAAANGPAAAAPTVATTDASGALPGSAAGGAATASRFCAALAERTEVTTTLQSAMGSPDGVRDLLPRLRSTIDELSSTAPESVSGDVAVLVGVGRDAESRIERTNGNLAGADVQALVASAVSPEVQAAEERLAGYQSSRCPPA